ncbi:MFS transporter [Lentibacter sp. XHP0401]|uniref:MFS transporter n=1 Tax=Lentibacter sp. XHP0401 TaxID=2984334 RepID=UPI0021E96A7F|nr:MFS transporter [Lentibacter sp. XHP0401]MCV2894858.1 MFS transporter [Lentibacter sp. XHP0401]
MFERRIPEWLRHAPAPSVHGFALLAGLEGVTRGMLISVFPIALYEALGSASAVSEVYFYIGLASLAVGLLVPYLNRFIPRRWLYALGASLFALGCALAIVLGPHGIVPALALNAMATVITFVCFNAYVLDYIKRIELGRSETLRMVYSALGWTGGPLIGISLYTWWQPAPFILSGASALTMMAIFFYMRLGNGKLITRARRASPNPLAFLARFAAQPRLIAGFSFAVIRSCGWWAYVVYLPIYAVQNGLSDQLGGLLLSITNATLFASPLILKLMQMSSVRFAVRTGFMAAALLFALGGLLESFPPLALAALFLASVFLITLDVCAGLPFLMAVKPSERTEMSAVYSSYRDVSGILTPGLSWAVLLVAPVSGIFLLTSGAFICAWIISSTLHPRLGARRLVPAE